jgi:hypothetical protein
VAHKSYLSEFSAWLFKLSLRHVLIHTAGNLASFLRGMHPKTAMFLGYSRGQSARMIQSSPTCVLDNLVGVQFTLYELKQELRNRGHDIHLQSLIEALKICHGVDLHMYRKDGSVMLASPIFPLLLIGSRQDWLKNPTETRCYVQFHPFITQCLSQLTYRQFDYGMYMRYRYRLSRWLHKRLAHNYVQASMLAPYTIRLSTILRDSGTQESAQNYNNPRSVERALDELHDEKILLAITKEILRGPRKRLVDIKYTLLPTVEFVTEIKRANRRTTILTERLQSVATHSNQDIGDAEEEVPRKIGDAEEEVLLENR